MKMNIYTTRLKSELMEEFERVCEEVNKGRLTSNEAHWDISEEAYELFDTCLDVKAMMEEAGKDFDADPYEEFLAWLTFKVMMTFEWDELCEVLNSEREEI